MNGWETILEAWEEGGRRPGRPAWRMAEGPGKPQLDNVPPERSEARFRLSQAVARIGNWEIDLTTGKIWGSEEAFRIYGLEVNPDHNLPLAEVQARPLPEYRSLLDRALSDLVSQGTPYDIRFRIRRGDDGTVRLVHSMARLVRDPAGRPSLVAGTVQDITEREERHQKMVEALAASEERARLAFERAADAILIFDASTTIVQANERAVTLTGRPLADLTGRNLRSLFSEAEAAAKPFRIEAIMAGETVTVERMLLRADGGEVPVEMSTRRFADDLFQVIARDVTERRQLEEQLQLRQRMDSLGTLAAGIAHDFNNILVGIMGFADLLRSDSAHLTAEQRESVENIVRASSRAADLVRGLSQLGRRGSLGETFDLAGPVSEVCAVLRETTDRIVEKVDRVPRHRHFLRGNPSDLYHALMNLGVNAVQAVLERSPPAGGWVRFEASEEPPQLPGSREPAPGRWIHLTVADSGVGMTPEVRRLAFDPHFSTKGLGTRGGQGLGLTMVYNIVVRQYGGVVGVETAPGAGTCFHVYLPRAEPRAEGAAPDLPAVPAASPRAGGSATVLVVDDEPQIVRLAQRALEPVGYRVLGASNGAEALEILGREKGVDLVILDRNMPRLSGTQALETLRAAGSHVRLILSTGGGIAEAEGATEVLWKPYTASQLREVVRRVLEGA